MTRGKVLTILLWLLGAAAAAGLSAVAMFSGTNGMVSAYALVPLMWSVALGAGFVDQVRQSGVLRGPVERLRAMLASGEPQMASARR